MINLHDRNNIVTFEKAFFHEFVVLWDTTNSIADSFSGQFWHRLCCAYFVGGSLNDCTASIVRGM